jgi:hypothetical protein
MATKHPARIPLVSATLDEVEYLLEHGTLARLPRRYHRYDGAVAGGHPIARTYAAAEFIQAGHHQPTPLTELRRPTSREYRGGRLSGRAPIARSEVG